MEVLAICTCTALTNCLEIELLSISFITSDAALCATPIPVWSLTTGFPMKNVSTTLSIEEFGYTVAIAVICPLRFFCVILSQLKAIGGGRLVQFRFVDK